MLFLWKAASRNTRPEEYPGSGVQLPGGIVPRYSQIEEILEALFQLFSNQKKFWKPPSWIMKTLFQIPDNQKEFASAFKNLLMNPEQRKEMGAYNKQKVGAYSDEIVRDELKNIYQKSLIENGE